MGLWRRRQARRASKFLDPSLILGGQMAPWWPQWSASQWYTTSNATTAVYPSATNVYPVTSGEFVPVAQEKPREVLDREWLDRELSRVRRLAPAL
jgi:hypothetical protein